MDATTETAIVERTISIDASPETVWEFFVDPEKLKQWKGIDANLEPQPGGMFRCEVIPGHIAAGEYVELDPPHRLVFTWGWEKSDSPTAIKPGVDEGGRKQARAASQTGLPPLWQARWITGLKPPDIATKSASMRSAVL